MLRVLDPRLYVMIRFFFSIGFASHFLVLGKTIKKRIFRVFPPKIK